MTGDPRSSFPVHDFLQFAPNFSVYVLPPDVVCFYSEDRTFFLHGELFCALVSAIGAGERSARELASELERQFPSAAVHEALKRLIERRYVLPASSALAGPIAAYWARLGLPPKTADENLRNCRVRIRSIDVEGATQLDSALRESGVRVVTRSPDLTVTLVGDYLDGRLDELNRQHLSDRTPWVLAQPSGVFPLVGPVFLPGKSACWTCVADRMRRNREVKVSTATRSVASPFRLSPGGVSDRAASSSQPSRSRKRSPPTFARNCLITSSASTYWVRPP